MGFLNPLEDVHLLVSPKPTVYNQVHFHDISRICPQTMLLDESDVVGRVTKLIIFSQTALRSLA